MIAAATLAAALAVMAPAGAFAGAPIGAAAGAQEGVTWVGRWLFADGAGIATYAGSLVLLNFMHSSSVTADLSALGSRGDQDLFISVAVDGGKPVRMGLGRGTHERVVLASGLSSGPHQVAIRKEGEPIFGALRFAHPRLEVAGRWRAVADERPVVEVIGDSDATGICVLGPDSPADASNIYRSKWASQSMSWVGLLEAELAGAGHPVDMVDLAISGSTAGSEAKSYGLTAPGYSSAPFLVYPQPGRRYASLVLMWGGANDRHAGGDTAAGMPAAAANLSKFEQGVYDQIAEIFARNPDVRIVLLDYIDAAIPAWTPAYEQVVGLLPKEQQSKILFLHVYDPKGKSDACEIDPKGHPNASMHQSWAAQIFAWMMSPEVFSRLNFPMGEQWYDQ